MSSFLTTLPDSLSTCDHAQFPFWTMAALPTANSDMESLTLLAPVCSAGTVEFLR